MTDAGEQVDLMEQRRILDDQCVGLEDRLAKANRLVGEPAERDNGGACPLRPEHGEGLRVLVLEERCDRQQFCRSDNTLTAASVNSHLEHPSSRSGSFVYRIVAPDSPADIRGEPQRECGELPSGSGGR